MRLADDHPEDATAAAEVWGRRGARRALVGRVVVDVVLPLVVYYVLRALGADVLAATLAAGAVPAANAALVAARSRRVDVAGLVVVSLFVAGGALSVVTGDARLLYIKDGWLTGLLGAWVLLSLAMKRPFMLHLGTVIATAKVGDAGAAAWQQRWSDDPVFRRRLRLVSVVVGVVLMLDAVARIAIASVIDLDAVATVTNVQYVVMLAGLLSWFFWYTARHGLRA
ncbi:VC0807 family protein [Micromonospora sp. NPDC049275]|uniref:VC0807 family protein n=1 Tax=Micromonospora sp. NPDC049275 TaxID=3364268 RepID=UPI003721621E